MSSFSESGQFRIPGARQAARERARPRWQPDAILATAYAQRREISNFSLGPIFVFAPEEEGEGWLERGSQTSAGRTSSG